MVQTKIGHAHLKVRDLDRATDFYSRFLGLKVTERVGDHYVFMTSGPMHHEIALQAVGENAPGQNPYGTGLYHVAFEVPDQRSLAEAFVTLADAGIDVATVDHLISWALYFNDPDGNGLEIYWDTRTEPGGATLWLGHNVPLPAAKLHAILAQNFVNAVKCRILQQILRVSQLLAS